jgi:simple sugar transport system ATP-binding protein/ribose transport system ATP-binding protein
VAGLGDREPEDAGAPAPSDRGAESRGAPAPSDRKAESRGAPAPRGREAEGAPNSREAERAGAAAAPDRATPHVELADVSKHFGAVRALDAVSLTVARGSIHALVGENGAGKSTLGRIVAGVLAPDAGRLLLDGDEVALRSPREALDRGVAAIAQELNVVPQLTVAENVFLGVEPRRSGFVARRALRRRYERLASEAGFELAASAPAGRLRPAEQQKVEILRALSRDAELIVMDEPTASLNREETAQLHEIVRSLARAGRTVLLVSHFLREVLELADTITVLRDGRVVRTAPADGETEDSLIRAMLGRPLTAAFPPKREAPADAPPALTVHHLRAPGIEDVTFDVRRGEIVGLAGLVGAGRTELARAVFGAPRALGGDVRIAGERPLTGGPRASLRAGLALIPESRKEDGLLLERSVTENVTLASLPSLSRGGFVRRRAERERARDVLDRWAVRAPGYGAAVSALSGGNQQKVLFARMLLCAPTVLIADEPTRGVDVGAKRAIYDLLVSLAEDGMGVLLISSELEELLGLAHRVLVMRTGAIVSELRGDAMTESAVLAAAFAA